MRTRNVSLAAAVMAMAFSTASLASADDCIMQDGSYSSPVQVDHNYTCGPTVARGASDGRHWLTYNVYSSGGSYYLYGVAGANVYESALDNINENNNQLERFHLYGLVVNSAGVETQVCELIWTQPVGHSSAACTAVPNRLRVYVNPQEP